jgi:hypothetical protein
MMLQLPDCRGPDVTSPLSRGFPTQTLVTDENHKPATNRATRAFSGHDRDEMPLGSALIDAISTDFHNGITQSARPEQNHTVQDHMCRLRAYSQSTSASTEHLIGENVPDCPPPRREARHQVDAELREG